MKTRRMKRLHFYGKKNWPKILMVKRYNILIVFYNLKLKALLNELYFEERYGEI